MPPRTVGKDGVAVGADGGNVVDDFKWVFRVAHENYEVI